MVMPLPLSSAIVQGLGGSIAADLLKGVVGAVAITGVSLSGGTLTINYRDTSDAPQTIVFAGGSGASITSGTVDPTGGAAGDSYVQVDASDVVVAIWLNESGTWNEYALPAGGGTEDGVVESLAFTISGQDVTLTAGLSVGADIVSGTLTLPGATADALSRFEAVTTANTTAQALSTTYADILEIATTDIFDNVGGFTVATTTNISTITVPNNGLFKVTCHIKAVTAGSARSQLFIRANVLRSGVVVDNSDTVMAGAYVRAIAGARSGLLSGTTTLLLEVGDTVTFQAAEETNTANTYTFGGADNVVEIVEIPSEVRGVAGADGVGVPTGGTDTQILAKASDVDLDTEWVDAPTGGGGGGLSTVATDATIEGDGTTGDPLALADDAVTTAKLAALSVHTGKINDDAVTADKLADNAVHHDSIADNAVRPDNIQASAVTTAKIAAGAVTVAKMDSGTATDGHVATADGSGGVAFEAPTGGGGGGTDDQTAAEVPVTATGFTGNLGSGDTDVQTALDTIDGLTLGGGGGAHTEQRVLEQDPNATADTLGKFQIDPQGNAYTTTPDTEHGTAAAGDFARFTHADYIGELSGEPNPLAQTLGIYYFLIVDHKLQVTANNAFGQLRWQDANWSDLLVSGASYRGARDNDASALPHITQDGDVFFDRNSDHIRVVSNFVAGVTPHTNYESKRLARVEEIPMVSPLFVERSTLPVVTDDSPDLVYLSHGHSVGVRADAIIDVEFSPNGVAGYSSGEISGVLGSTNTPSPLAELFGLGDANDYLIESVYWLNRSDFEEFESIYLNNIRYVLGDIFEVPGGGAFLRRIENYPTGLATAQLNVNFERTDNSFYFNDGAMEVADRGLYQKVDNGQGVVIYDQVPTISVRHRDQIGPPGEAPHKAGLLDTDDLGRLWVAGGQVFRVLTSPTGDSEVMSLADLGPQYVPDPAGYADLQDRGGEGAWYVERFTHNHVQIQGPALSDLVLVLTWIDVWNWLVANVTGYNTATFIFNRDETTFLGSYSSEDDALEELQFVLGGHPFPDLATHQYVYSVTHTTPMGVSKIRRITAFTPGQVQRRDDFHWVGPHATVAYVDTALQEAGQETLDGLSANATQSTAELNTHAGDPDAHHTPGGGGTTFSIPGLDAQDTPVAADDLAAVWDASDGATEKVTLGVIRTFMQDGLAGGLTLSDADPADVGDAAAPGDGSEASRDNHGHRVPIDSTLEFNANDELAVNVQDVIEHLQERIQYHTASNNYSSDAGATVGQAYATSQYRKIITKVEVLLNPLVGADAYLVRLDELNADNSIKAKLFTSQTRSAPFGLGVSARAFNFHDADGDIGVTIAGSIRLGILISRLGDNSDSAVAAVHGAEAANSPRETYDDASTDFNLENDVVYQHIDPAIGASTHSHGTDIRGNIKIFYTLIVDHGNLVGAPPELTPAMVESATDDTFGTVSGERLAQAIAAGDAASVDGFSFVSLTQAEYDALTPDANTIYLVTA